jgi:hypothetical protein
MQNVDAAMLHVSTRGNTCRGRLFLNLVGIWLPLNPFQHHRVFQLQFDNTSSAPAPTLSLAGVLAGPLARCRKRVLHQGYTSPLCFTRRFDRCGSVAGPKAPSHLRVLRSVRLIGLKREMITERSLSYPDLF